MNHIEARRLKIALDYDRTYTADKQLWYLFIKQAIALGHDVKFVTWRFKDANRYADPKWRSNEDIETDARYNKVDVVYCDHGPKQKYYSADIWIDDQPATIIASAILIDQKEERV